MLKAAMVRCVVTSAIPILLSLGFARPISAQTPQLHQNAQAYAVFAADGAGNFQCSSETLRKTAVDDELPIEVYCFEWSHGYLRVLADQVSYDYARGKGRWLAEVVLSYHRKYPDTPIYLYGHSAGCTVVMAALEALPPDVVERAILLSPSLSASYDLRSALRNVKHGVHVFYSRRDSGWLDVCRFVVGTADRRFECCSGQIGFEVDPNATNLQLQAKLFQRAWQPEDRILGNDGGHFGQYQPDFLRAYIFPLIVPKDQSPSPRS